MLDTIQVRVARYRNMDERIFRRDDRTELMDLPVWLFRQIQDGSRYRGIELA